MVSKTARLTVFSIIGVLVATQALHADNPRWISYQGKISGADAGPVDIDVVFYDSSVGGAVLFGESHLNVPLSVGVFSIMLGSETGGGVPDAALDAVGVWVGVSVDGGVELSPRTRIGMVPFAAQSDVSERLVRPNTFDIVASTASSTGLAFETGTWPLLTAGHNNATAKRMWIGHSESFPTWGLQYRDVSSDGYPSDSIEFVAGDQTLPRMSFRLSTGIMTLADSTGNQNLRLDASTGIISSEDSLQVVEELGGAVYGSLHRRPAGGGQLQLWDAGGFETIDINGDSLGSGEIRVKDAGGATSVLLAGFTGAILLTDPVSNDSALLFPGQTAGFNGPGLRFTHAGVNTMEFLSMETSTQGATFTMRANDGTLAMDFQAEEGDAQGPFLRLYNRLGIGTIEIDADEAEDAAIRLSRTDGTETIVLDADVSDRGAVVWLNDEAGSLRLLLDASSGSSTQGAAIRMYNNQNIETLTIDADEANEAPAIRMRTGAGVQNVVIDADWNGTGSSRLVIDVVQINGGSDLSEQFDVTGGEPDVMPGMVVSIDRENPGKLTVATEPYDKRVAGIVSGAGGVKPGMLMGQTGTIADGQYPIALTGRVWVKCDAASGAIEPGDMLTTSATPGHAMKAGDHSRAFGAIIGKAMTALDSGKGLVLVLVSLQ